MLLGIGQEAADHFDQTEATRQAPVGAYRIEHLSEPIMAGLQQLEECRARTVVAGTKPLVKRLQLMGEVADLGDVSHARTAFERMQITLQGFQLVTVFDVAEPALQRCASTLDDVEPFLEEDLHQFRITVFPTGIGCRLGNDELFVELRLVLRRLGRRIDVDTPIVRHRFRHRLRIGLKLALFADQPGCVDQFGGSYFFDGDLVQFGNGVSARRPLFFRKRIDHLESRHERLPVRPNVAQQLQGIAHWLTRLQLLELHRQLVMAALQQLRQLRRMHVAAVGEPFVERLQLMGQVADGADLGHPRTAFERMQVAQQCRQRQLVIRIVQPALQRLAGAFQQIDRFIQEDFGHLLVLLVIFRQRRVRPSLHLFGFFRGLGLDSR